MKNDVFQTNFKKTLGIISAILFSLVILAVIFYSITYAMSKPSKPLKPSKKIFSMIDKVVYGPETIQILEAKEMLDSDQCTTEEVEPSYVTPSFCKGSFDSLFKDGCEKPYIKIQHNILAIKMHIANYEKNVNSIWADRSQFYLIEKNKFDDKERNIKPGDENSKKEPVWYCNSESHLTGKKLKTGERTSGWIFFEKDDGKTFKDYYLIANLFDGSPLLVFNLN